MTNYETGHKAEEYAEKCLKKLKYKIVATNWKTRYCEIDIIAERKKVIHFIEVKYRKNNLQGTGLDYITEAKQEQMRFAAEIWIQENNWQREYSLGAIEMTGPDYQVTNFLPVL